MSNPSASKIVAQELTCRVERFEMLTPTTFELGFTVDKPFQFIAGQFLSALIPGAGPGGRDLRRAYSIASWPEKPQIELCIKIVEGGPGTSFLSKLRRGDTFKGVGPYGDFVYRAPAVGAPRDAVFIATGTGVAPFRAIAQSAAFKKNPPRSATILHGVRMENELLYVDELKSLPLTWVPAVSQPTPAWSGFRGRVTELLRSGTYDWAASDFYLCGNGEMIKEVKALLTEKGVPKESILQEKYY